MSARCSAHTWRRFCTAASMRPSCRTTAGGGAGADSGGAGEGRRRGADAAQAGGAGGALCLSGAATAPVSLRVGLDDRSEPWLSRCRGLSRVCRGCNSHGTGKTTTRKNDSVFFCIRSFRRGARFAARVRHRSVCDQLIMLSAIKEHPRVPRRSVRPADKHRWTTRRKAQNERRLCAQCAESRVPWILHRSGRF